MSFINTIYEYDFSILNFIQDMLKCGFMDGAMAFFSYIGVYGAVWIVCAVVMLFFKKSRPAGAMMLCAMAAGHLIGVVALKNLIARPRPFTYFPDLVLNISPPSGYSFPSGHSCSSFAAAVVLMFYDKKFGVPALIVAFFIAFSRLYNYVHFPSDVLCGALLGVLCAVAVVLIFRKTKLDLRLSRELRKRGDNANG